MNSNYKILLILATFLAIAQQFYAISVPLIIYQHTNSVINMSVARAMEFVPNILFAPIIGTFVDNVRIKKMLLVSLYGQFISLFVLYYLFFYENNLYIVYLVIILFMGFNLIFNNIRNTVVKYTIPYTLITQANSYLQLATQTMQICIPLLAGTLLLYFNADIGLVICFICLLSCVFITKYMNIKQPAQDPITVKLFSLYSMFVAPLKLLKNHHTLLHLTIIAMIVNMAEGISGIMYIYLFKNSLHLSNAAVGLCCTSIGAGAILGGILAPYLRKQPYTGSIRCLLASSILLYFILSISNSYYMILLIIFAQSGISMIVNIYIWSLRQELTDIKIMGKITGITSAIFKLGMPLSIIVVGYVVAKCNVHYAFAICAAIYVAAWLYSNSYARHSA